MSRFIVCAVMLAMAAQLASPAEASEIAAYPSYGIWLFWRMGDRTYVPRLALSVTGGAQMPLYEPTPAYEKKADLSCPAQGCPPAFLAAVGTVYALGIVALVKAAEKD